MTKNKFMALSSALNTNNISLEKDEFKIVLDIANGKDVPSNLTSTLSPLAQVVATVFAKPDLDENQFYVLKTNDQFIVVKNRNQLLAKMVEIISPTNLISESNILIHTFGEDIKF